MIVPRVALGAAIGVVSFVALAFAQMFGLGLQVGVVLGIDGTAIRAITPAPLVAAGVVVAALGAAGMLLVGRMPRSTLLAAAVVLAALVTVGTLRFPWDYLLSVGDAAWYDNVLVNGSQTLATYLLIGLAAGGVVPRQRRQDASDSPS